MNFAYPSSFRKDQAMQALDTGVWLQAIDDHPDTTPATLLAAHGLLGALTDLTDDQQDAGVVALQTLGFLGVSDISGDEWTYALAMPR